MQEEMDSIKEDLKELKADVGGLKGESFERRVREKAPAYFGKIIRRCRSIDIEQLNNLLEDAVDAGLITDDERAYALMVDVVVEGTLRKDHAREVVLVGEVFTRGARTKAEELGVLLI